MGELHTPGPWGLDMFPDYVDGTDMEVLDMAWFPIAEVAGRPIINRWHERYPKMNHWAEGADDGRTQVCRSQPELEANARLIAAAPELLEALEKLIRDARPSNWDDDEDMDQWQAWLAADAAIAKARGAA